DEVPLLLQNVHRHLGMQLHQQVVPTTLEYHAAHRPLHPAHYRLGGEHAAAPVACRTRFSHALVVALPHPLPRHLHQAQIAHRKCLGARAVAREMVPDLLKHLVTVRLALHVDEVRDDDPAHVAQPELPRDFRGSLHVGPKYRLFRVLLARITPRVHIDRDQCFGRLDDEITTRWEIAATLEDVPDLRLDLELVEQRRLLGVQLHARDQVRRDVLQIVDYLVEDLLGIDSQRIDL